MPVIGDLVLIMDVSPGAESSTFFDAIVHRFRLRTVDIQPGPTVCGSCPARRFTVITFTPAHRPLRRFRVKRPTQLPQFRPTGDVTEILPRPHHCLSSFQVVGVEGW